VPGREGKGRCVLNLENWQTQLRKGLLEMVVLKMLSCDEHHGYEMVQKLKTIRGLKIREGNIYPILARLQTDGLVRSRTEVSRDGPPRKYFALTESGQRVLGDMCTHWDETVESIRQIEGGT
jgi:PadR family transcriptional regulator PadR